MEYKYFIEFGAKVRRTWRVYNYYVAVCKGYGPIPYEEKEEIVEICGTPRDIDTKRFVSLEGYVFEEDETILGYAMVAKSFSTEYGKPCVWIEDLYLKSEYRGEGTGSRFLRLMEEKYPGSVFRLEVEEENERAVRLYRQCGFDVLPYMEMKKVCSE